MAAVEACEGRGAQQGMCLFLPSGVETNVNGHPEQPLQLGLFRSDYMVHLPDPNGPASLKQVEFNTISSSFGALSQQVAGLHRCVFGQPDLRATN